MTDGLAHIDEPINEITSIPASERAEVWALESLFERAYASKSVGKVLREGANEFRKGWKYKTLDAKYWKWVRAGRCTSALVNRTKVKQKTIALDGYIAEDKTRLGKAFLDYWRQLCLENQRCDSAAFTKLCHQWRNGDAIPGYGTWRQWWMSTYSGHAPDICPGLPDGWSRRNLSRFSPPEVEKVAARTGRTAARSLGPLVWTTRKNLRVGQFYMWDDLWHDILVNFIGVNTRALRPLELACLDVFSGSKIAYGLKPSIWDMAEEKKKMLTEVEMRFLLAHVFINIGYSPEGCTNLVEHGTAAVSDFVEGKLHDLTGGVINFDRSGIEGAAAFAGAYCGSSKGNFRLKAALESHHNLPHTYLADLPGQTGPQQRFGPEELHGRNRHNDALLQVMAALPPERGALLRLPLIHFTQFAQVYAEINDLIDCRFNHQLEGFEEAGLVVPMFRLDKSLPPIPMSKILDMPPEKRAAIEAIASLPGHSEIRRMSPREVYKSQAHTLRKLPISAAAIFLHDQIIERPVDANGLFEFEHRDLGPGTHRYLAMAKTAEGFIRRLRDKETYGTIINPINPDQMLVLDAAGAVLGVCQRWEKVDRADTEAITHQMGKAAAEFSERIAPLAKLGRAKIRRRIEDLKHNEDVVNDKPITPEEHQRFNAMKKYVPAAIVTNDSGDDDFDSAAPLPAVNKLL